MTIDFDKVEFDTSNPEPRCPCMLLLDTSGSMSGHRIDELNAGLQAFKDALSKDPLAMLRVEVAIITFGGSATLIQDFVTADQFNPPTLTADGGTPMGQAINLALDTIENRKRIYEQNGISRFRPWAFLITDGEPTDGSVWRTAAQRVHEAEANKKVAFFCVGVEGADFNILGQISTRQAVKLKGLEFGKMFEWLSSSLTRVSHSRPEENVPLQSPMGWAEIDIS